MSLYWASSLFITKVFLACWSESEKRKKMRVQGITTVSLISELRPTDEVSTTDDEVDKLETENTEHKKGLEQRKLSQVVLILKKRVSKSRVPGSRFQVW